VDQTLLLGRRYSRRYCSRGGGERLREKVPFPLREIRIPRQRPVMLPWAESGGDLYSSLPESPW
jgi:hypothetical protein